MAASQVVLYFDKAEDALLFTLAASSVISAESPVRSQEAVVKVASQISKASRIMSGGVLNTATEPEDRASNQPHGKCA